MYALILHPYTCKSEFQHDISQQVFLGTMHGQCPKYKPGNMDPDLRVLKLHMVLQTSHETVTKAQLENGARNVANLRGEREVGGRGEGWMRDSASEPPTG